MRLSLLGLVLIGACSPRAVRLQLPLGVRVHAVDGVVWSDATWDLDAIRLRGAASAVRDLGWGAVEGAADALPASPAPIPWTVGFSEPLDLLSPATVGAYAAPYRALDIASGGELRLLGTGPLGQALDLVLVLPDLEATASASQDFGEARGNRAAKTVLVELGGEGWTDALDTWLAADTTGRVREGSADHEALVAGLLADVVVAIDNDGDSVLSADERAGALLALTPAPSDPVSAH